MNGTEGKILYIIEKLGCATDRQVGLIAAFVHGLDIVGMDAGRSMNILAQFEVAGCEAGQKVQARKEVAENE